METGFLQPQTIFGRTQPWPHLSWSGGTCLACSSGYPRNCQLFPSGLLVEQCDRGAEST